MDQTIEQKFNIIVSKTDSLTSRVDKNSEDIRFLALEVRKGFARTEETMDEFAGMVKRNFDRIDERFDRIAWEGYIGI